MRLLVWCSSVVGRCLCWSCRFKARRRWRSIEIPGASAAMLSEPGERAGGGGSLVEGGREDPI